MVIEMVTEGKQYSKHGSARECLYGDRSTVPWRGICTPATMLFIGL